MSKHLSHEEIADKLNVSRQSISKWELNEALPEPANLILLRNIFKVSIDYLLIDEIEDSDLNTYSYYKSKSLVSKWRRILLFIGIGLIILGILVEIFGRDKLPAKFDFVGRLTIVLGLVCC